MVAPIDAARLSGYEAFLLILLWVIPFLLAIWLGRQKRRRGWLYGLLLGWIGVFILASLGDNPRGPKDDLDDRGSFIECPHCRLLTPKGREFCRICHRSVTRPANDRKRRHQASGSRSTWLRTLH